MEQGHEVVDLLDNKVASKISGQLLLLMLLLLLLLLLLLSNDYFTFLLFHYFLMFFHKDFPYLATVFEPQINLFCQFPFTPS